MLWAPSTVLYIGSVTVIRIGSKGEAEVEYDATKTPVWAELVGHPLSLQYRDPEQQVLEVRSRDAVVFCCNFERLWHMDKLYVGRHLPEGVGGPAAA